MAYHRNPIYDKGYEMYLAGLSLDQVAKEIGVTRQAVYKAFRQRGLKMRGKNFKPIQYYDGIKFTLRPSGYYASTGKKRIQMHRYVWEKEAMVKIPPGFDVHHINNDKSDNRFENLECLSKSDHTRNYAKFNNQYGKGRRPIELIDQNGDVVSTYSCTSVCAKALGISSSAIRQALIGKTKKCKGYVFRYTTN